MSGRTLAQWRAGPVVAALAVVTLAFATPAFACTMFATSEAETLRMQREIGADSDAVYVGEVTRIAALKRGGTRVYFKPVAAFEGIAPPSVTTDYTRLGCPGPEWRVGDVAVVYADKIDWREDLFRWGQWFVNAALSPEESVDPKIRAVLRGVTARRTN